VTAGFWSKDEILASQWYSGETLIFWVLALSALLTAFYTARQVVLTFLGEPRSGEELPHAPESVKAMTVPLASIPLCGRAGLVWHPSRFSGVGRTFPRTGLNISSNRTSNCSNSSHRTPNSTCWCS
jgi:NADH-quinone oxidoreductase subunit L